MRRSAITYGAVAAGMLWVLPWLLAPVLAQGPAGRVISYTTSDGLSDGTIKTIFEDSRGYLWFGTFNGANKFNGYEFTNYLSSASDSTSLSHRQVNAIAEDRAGRLWMGTNLGIDLYNFDQDNFIRVRLRRGERFVDLSQVQTLAVGPANTLWVLTPSALYRAHLPAGPGLPRVLEVTAVYDPRTTFGFTGARFAYLTADPAGNLWL
ncbi:MAG: hypothetical protein ICV83_31490, partial [Cytophagales bacterium]|nr:hypothetical protein [Cytophagales bacterium]